MTEPLLDHSRGNTRILQDRDICVTQGMRSGTQGSSDGFLVSRIISRVPGSTSRGHPAPSLGEIALEVWLDQLFLRSGDRTGEPASSLIHRRPTFTQVPEKWIRWLANRGEEFFEARSAVNWVLLLTSRQRNVALLIAPSGSNKHAANRRNLTQMESLDELKDSVLTPKARMDDHCSQRRWTGVYRECFPRP